MIKREHQPPIEGARDDAGGAGFGGPEAGGCVEPIDAVVLIGGSEELREDGVGEGVEVDGAAEVEDVAWEAKLGDERGEFVVEL